ncbi:MAG TPA: 2-dehydro-3-deoxy-6-phosphogalactonate aldolase [Sphingomicrobium sp.]
MTATQDFQRHFADCPLIAIIRGVRPKEVEAIGEALYQGGIRIIEVPLNSPDPLDSIARLAAVLGDKALVGAGTVLSAEQVDQVRDAGGRLVVSPNMNRDVIVRTNELGLVSCPGAFTPTEAFAAIDAGAHALKFFPAEAGSPAVIKAMRTVLPRHIPILAVGGVTVDTLAGWRAAGADGAGVSSALYRPGQNAADTGQKAAAFVSALRA